MKEQEIAKFEAILELYADVIKHHNDFYVARFAELGYVSIQYIRKNGLIEQGYVHRTPSELYQFLEEGWEGDWIYDYADEIGIKDMDYDVFAANLPKEKKEELRQLHKIYQEKAEAILKTE